MVDAGRFAVGGEGCLAIPGGRQFEPGREALGAGCLDGSIGAGDGVVADEVHVHVLDFLVAIDGPDTPVITGAPVEYHVVAVIEEEINLRARADARVAAKVVGVEVVVEGHPAVHIRSDQRAVAVVLGIESFGDDTPLRGHVGSGLGEGEVLVQSPGDRAVVHDDILRAAEPEAVAVVATGVAVAESHVSNDHIMRHDRRAFVCQADAVPGGGLARDGDEGRIKPKPLFQMYCSGDREQHHPRLLGQNGPSQAAGDRWLILVTEVLKSGDQIDLAASSTGRISAESFRARERAKKFFAAARRSRGCLRRVGGDE